MLLAIGVAVGLTLRIAMTKHEMILTLMMYRPRMATGRQMRYMRDLALRNNVQPGAISNTSVADATSFVDSMTTGARNGVN